VRSEVSGDEVGDPDPEVHHLAGLELLGRASRNHRLRVAHGRSTRWSTYRCGVAIDSGSSSPTATTSPTSAIVIVAAVAMSGLKLRAVCRYQRLPSSSARAA